MQWHKCWIFSHSLKYAWELISAILEIYLKNTTSFGLLTAVTFVLHSVFDTLNFLISVFLWLMKFICADGWVFRYVILKTVTKILILGKWMHNVNAESASTTVALLRYSLTQLWYLQVKWRKFCCKMSKTAYQKHTGSLDYVRLTGEDRDASFSFDIVVWKLPMRSWDPSLS